MSLLPRVSFCKLVGAMPDEAYQVPTLYAILPASQWRCPISPQSTRRSQRGQREGLLCRGTGAQPLATLKTLRSLSLRSRRYAASPRKGDRSPSRSISSSLASRERGETVVARDERRDHGRCFTGVENGFVSPKNGLSSTEGAEEGPRSCMSAGNTRERRWDDVVAVGVRPAKCHECQYSPNVLSCQMP